jgi:hypothetical protein
MELLVMDIKLRRMGSLPQSEHNIKVDISKTGPRTRFQGEFL